jgi:hypothetical protein
MPQSSKWARIRKPLIVGFFIAASIVICFFLLHLTGGAAEVVFKEVLGSFSAIAIFGTTLSVALFNYVDNISKDVGNLKGDKEKIKNALSGLSLLKKEVVVNAGFILALLVLELAVKGLMKSIPPSDIPFNGFYWVALSIRFSLFSLAVLAASEQIRGLLVAIEYRNLIHAGKSSNN